MFPPSHQPDRPRYPPRICAQLIYGAAGHPLRYVCLPPPDVHPDGVDHHDLHCLYCQAVPPLSAFPAFRNNHHDTSRHPLVEPLQYLEHLTNHHPYFSTTQENRLSHHLCKSLSRTTPLLPAFPEPLIPLTTASEISAGFTSTLVYSVVWNQSGGGEVAGVK